MMELMLIGHWMLAVFGEELESAGPERARGVQGGGEGVVVVLPVWSLRPPIMQGQCNN